MMKDGLIICFLVLTLSAMVQAKPASWYRWYSKHDGQTVCKQTSPGTGWVREKTAYRDARCEVAGRR